MLEVSGGTHVPWSPCFHDLQLFWVPTLKRVGFELDLTMERAGFYPKGGGLVRAGIRPASLPLQALQVAKRGPLVRIHGVSGVAKLDLSIAERQKGRALKRLDSLGVPLEINVQRVPARSPGTYLVLVAEFVGSCARASALGERGRPAERVADDAVDQIEETLASGAAIDRHMADQLLLPLALAKGESRFTTARVTNHVLTNADVIRQFLPEARVEIDGAIGSPGRVWVLGRG